MGTRRPAVLVAAGMLAVATGVVGCATQHGASSDPERDKLKIKVEVDHTSPEPLKVIRIGGITPDPNYFLTCTQNDITGGKCKRPGYPLKRDGSGEYLGPLSREPVLILTDVASPGQTCVCYGNRCYCR